MDTCCLCGAEIGITDPCLESPDVAGNVCEKCGGQHLQYCGVCHEYRLDDICNACSAKKFVYVLTATSEGCHECGDVHAVLAAYTNEEDAKKEEGRLASIPYKELEGTGGVLYRDYRVSVFHSVYFSVEKVEVK